MIKVFKTSKNKFLEIQWERGWAEECFSLRIFFTNRFCDHHGVTFMLVFFHCYLGISWYDNRHADMRWEKFAPYKMD